MNLFISYLLKFLSLLALFIILVLVLINYLPSHTNVSFEDLLDLKRDINVSHPLLTVTSFLKMSHLLSLLFILSLYLLHLCLHLIKYIFQLSLILQLCLVFLKIPLIHHLSGLYSSSNFSLSIR